jgi:uncharacterized protein (DUF427 family)
VTKATWNDAVLAEKDCTEVLKSTHCFPPDALRRAYFRKTSTHTVCGWKSAASYYDLIVNGQTDLVQRQLLILG